MNLAAPRGGWKASKRPAIFRDGPSFLPPFMYGACIGTLLKVILVQNFLTLPSTYYQVHTKLA